MLCCARSSEKNWLIKACLDKAFLGVGEEKLFIESGKD
jgi:hypothetical protein